MPVNQVVTVELARHLSSISRRLSRQVGVLIARDGTIRNVIVGDSQRLEIPEIGRLRGGLGRFRGLRLVHTHLRGEPLSNDDLNDLALLRLDLVAGIAARKDGLPGFLEFAYVLPPAPAGNDAGPPFEKIRVPTVQQLDFDFLDNIRALEREFSRLARGSAGATPQERALAIGVSGSEERLLELCELIDSADVMRTGQIKQSRRRIHPVTVVGQGKLQEIALASMQQQAEVAILDVDLKPAQARAFEGATGLRSIDRTQLILDIFAQRAKSRDGKLQVELAQLKYALPRLTDRDSGLSRLSGGIGTRGPGETVLEVGRRRIRDRIRALQKKIAKLSRQRDLRRQRRRRQALPVVSLIGYTNAGKSTLLNALTGSQVATQDKLFLTLDPISRRLRYPGPREVVVTDTVGFIADLPPDLLTAFRATLEELAEANLLLHIVDAAQPGLRKRLEAVETTLRQLSLHPIPQLLVFNKADLVEPNQMRSLVQRHGAIGISAQTGSGIGQLVDRILAMVAPGTLMQQSTNGKSAWGREKVEPSDDLV